MNLDKQSLIIFFVYYFYTYGIPPILINYFLYFRHLSHDFLNNYNKIIYPEYWIKNNEHKKENEVTIIKEKIQKKYEDKYLDEIRKMNKEWVFTDDERLLIPKLKETFLNGYIENMNDRIDKIINEINHIEKEIVEDNNDIKYVEDFDDDGNELIHETLEERNEDRRDKIKKLQEEYDNLKRQIGTEDGLDSLINKSEQHAIKNIINKRLEKLDNCYAMEKTPIGNVLMIYDKEMNKFKYYSDASMPYRYLEVVGRKYIKLFNCRPIFVDMEEELRLFEEKWEKEQELKKKKEEDEKLKAEEVEKQITETKKKNVFAKFKSYNKDSGSKISMAPPPKNNMSSKSVTENKENEKVILKERANCYSYEGKLSNFNFLKKVEKKVFNKKLGISFAEFKKMNK